MHWQGNREGPPGRAFVRDVGDPAQVVSDDDRVPRGLAYCVSPAHSPIALPATKFLAPKSTVLTCA